MIVRQLNETQYQQLTSVIRQTAHPEPMDASYTIPMVVNEVEYAVRVQPERHNKIAVLQATRVDRSASTPQFELITQGQVLSSFFELFLYQQVGNR